MKDNKQKNKEKLPNISSLCGHKNDEEYMKHLEKIYARTLRNNISRTILRKYANKEIWEASRKLPNDERISAIGKTKKEAEEKLTQKYEYYLKRLKFIEKVKQEKLAKQEEIESPEME